MGVPKQAFMLTEMSTRAGEPRGAGREPKQASAVRETSYLERFAVNVAELQMPRDPAHAADRERRNARVHVGLLAPQLR